MNVDFRAGATERSSGARVKICSIQPDSIVDEE
jgi:hypothetical protein